MPTALPGLPLSVDDDLVTDEMMKDQAKLWAKKNRRAGKPNKRTKGGPGSGNFDHAGRPGKVGGSAPDHGKAGVPAPAKDNKPSAGGAAAEPKGDYQAPKRERYNRGKYTSLSIPERKSAWEELSTNEQDQQANARESIPKYQQQLLADAGKRPAFTGDPKKAIAERLSQTKDFVHPEAHDRITKVVGNVDDLLTKMNTNPTVRYKLGMEMVDALIAQENEAMGRQLGDHGIHHIQGNIDTALDILSKVPGTDSDRDKAAVMIANIFHDTGYMTEPSRDFLDDGHPRWSAEHYDENIRPIVRQAIGSRMARDITHMIRTHAGTDIDWENDPTASAVRVADNISVFYKDKLPPIFRYASGNVSTLIDLHNKKIDLPTAQKRMIDNINKSNASPKVKTALIRGAKEVNAMTGKFTLGMLGGRIDNISWTGNHLKVSLRENKTDTVMNQLLDLGQKQFGKFAKSYKIDPAQFQKSLGFKFPPDGRTVLELVVTGKAVKEWRFPKVLGILYGRR